MKFLVRQGFCQKHSRHFRIRIRNLLLPNSQFVPYDSQFIAIVFGFWYLTHYWKSHVASSIVKVRCMDMSANCFLLRYLRNLRIPVAWNNFYEYQTNWSRLMQPYSIFNKISPKLFWFGGTVIWNWKETIVRCRTFK